MTSLRILAAALLLSVAGCAAPGGQGVEQPSVAGSLATDGLVLRVDSVGGMIAPGARFAEIPAVSVYGDGRVITAGPMIDIYPAPALPALQVRRIGPAGVARLVGSALDAGVGNQTDLGVPTVADAPATRFTLRTATGVRVTEAQALGLGGDEGLTAAQRAARQRLTHLVEKLRDEAAGDSELYHATGVAAVATAWAEQGGDQGLPPQQPQAWPGPALPGNPSGDPSGGPSAVRCVSATGEQAVPVLAAAAKANSRTPWTSSGATWQVTFRPLLPDESTCADLIR